ncbi:MAG: hypothetical protein ACOVS5_12590 [Oligoflexus sp.]|jgi:hypothetical protein
MESQSQRLQLYRHQIWSIGKLYVALLVAVLLFSVTLRAEERNSVDLYLLGLASPVGIFGLTYSQMGTDSLGWQVGYGGGLTGEHFTANTLYVGDIESRGWNSGFLLGLSYAGGAREADGHSEDFLWTNLAMHWTYQSETGLRYGVELGVTVIVAEAIFHKNTFDQEALKGHILGGLDPKTGDYNVGRTLPQITLLKIGYGW